MHKSVPLTVEWKYCHWLGWNQWACISITKKYSPWPFFCLEPSVILLPSATCHCKFFSPALRGLGCPYRDSDNRQIQVRVCQASFRLLYLSCPFLSALNWLYPVSAFPEGAISPQHGQWLTILASLQLSCILSCCLLMAVFSKCFKSRIIHAWQFGLYMSLIKSSYSAKLISHFLRPAD